MTKETVSFAQLKNNLLLFSQFALEQPSP